MKKSLLLLFAFSLSHFLTATAQQNDTITVQAFTFGSPQDAWFAFPPDTSSYEKILMHYKLKCNPAQSPACGEWDYLTYSYLYDHTGVLDSTLYTAPSFAVGGLSPDTFSFMTSPSYSYSHHYQYYISYTDTTSLNSYNVGLAQNQSNETFNSANDNARSQYIWTAAELSTAGVSAGNITAIAFQFDVPGSELKNFTIRIKHSSFDSLTVNEYENSGFQTVFQQNTTVASSGIKTFNFTTPFNWDGTSNIVVDLSFSNIDEGIANISSGETTGWYSGIVSTDTDNYLDFEGPDYVSVPSQAFAALDSFVTVMFWQYGDPNMQPQDNINFEGNNAQNQRVLNVHLPWSNGNIYWDAGNNSGNFDRIELAAQPAQYEGQWNHWTFTKNVATGSMKIYLNGTLFHSGTGMTRTMEGITNFKIGSGANGNNNYDGYTDEFSLWNKELDAATIQAWMNKDIDATHPDYSNLLFYYPFNETTSVVATDVSANGFNGNLAGIPARKAVKGWDIFRNFSETQHRPFIVMEQGVFQSHLDSVVVIDTIENPQIQVLVYADSLNPLVATDSILAWPTYYNDYIFDNAGNATDSSFVTPDDTVFLSTWEYYGLPFEVIDRYEIGRFITPYGFGLDLHDGFTWVYDVSDFEPLLHDSVHLSGGNWQELLDVKFEFIKGTPPREVLSVENIWNGDFALSNFDTRVTAKTLMMNPAAAMYNLKTVASGHGWDNPTNCAEFCPKTHTIKVGATTVRSFSLWKKCASNALYPQGGTWLIDRAGWCPGAKVDIYNTDLTTHVTAGDSATIDYNIQSDQYGNYVFEAQLISYDAPSFSVDAAVDDIISPSNKDERYRENPICSGPRIIIKNTGTTALTSLDITYGVVGGTPSTQSWTGNLDFLETEEVTLGALNWTGTNGAQSKFEVSVSNPNGGTDQYAHNNTMHSTFDIPNILDYSFVILTKANNVPTDNSWTLKDENGNVLYSRDNMDANATYKDTVVLPNGCFQFELIDLGEDGMDWWADDPNINAGYIRFKSATSTQTLENFDSHWTIAGSASQYRGDFGSGIKYHFTTGWGLSVDENNSAPEIHVYPNPSDGQFTIDLLFATNENASVEVFDVAGQLIYSKQLSGSDFYTQRIDLNENAKGIYVVTVKTATEVITRKIIVSGE